MLELVDQLKQRGVTFALAGVREEVLPELEEFGIVAKVGNERIFATPEEAIAAFDASPA
jgi:MFS superfamily sulfate permease-like transporter